MGGKDQLWENMTEIDCVGNVGNNMIFWCGLAPSEFSGCSVPAPLSWFFHQIKKLLWM